MGPDGVRFFLANMIEEWLFIENFNIVFLLKLHLFIKL